MKLWIIVRTEAAIQPYNVCGWSKSREVGSNGIYVEAVHAFFRRKEANQYRKQHYKDSADLFKVISVTPH